MFLQDQLPKAMDIVTRTRQYLHQTQYLRSIYEWCCQNVAPPELYCITKSREQTLRTQRLEADASTLRYIQNISRAPILPHIHRWCGCMQLCQKTRCYESMVIQSRRPVARVLTCQSSDLAGTSLGHIYYSSCPHDTAACLVIRRLRQVVWAVGTKCSHLSASVWYSSQFDYQGFGNGELHRNKLDRSASWESLHCRE